MEPFPSHSYDGGLFDKRRCLLVDRALTGSLDGKTVEMDGDGTRVYRTTSDPRLQSGIKHSSMSNWE